MLLRDLGEPRQVDVRLERRLLIQHLDRLGDVDRRVAHALEVGGDLHRRDQEAEVAGRRLLQRQHPVAGVVDLLLELVDLGVGADHRVSARRRRARGAPASPR